MRRSVPRGAPGPGFFIALGLLQAVWPLTMDLYLPSFPQVQASLDTTPALVQLTLTAAFIGMAVGQLLAGPISDAVGRTRPLAVALVLYALAAVACSVAPTIEFLVAGRLAQGFSAAACSVIAISIVRDVASGARMLRLLAHLSVITGFFVVLSPALGAQFLEVMDWRGLFWVLTGYAGLLAVLFVAVFRRRETNPLERRMLRGTTRVGADYAALFGSRMFVAFVIGGGLIFGGMMTYMSSSAFLFQDV